MTFLRPLLLPANAQVKRFLFKLIATGLFGLATVSSAQAAGGAHIVDDAGVETPGVCHLETWVSRHSTEGGLLNLAPACTFESVPYIEFGAAAQRTWGPGADTTLGPALKLNLRPLDTGIGFGVIGTAAWSVGTGQVETASLILPVSFQLHERVRANINVGWHYLRTHPRQNQAFVGAQIEADIARDLSVMAEAFTRDEGRPGAQVGLRWNPNRGNVDVDLLSGWRTDGVTPWTITLGVTIRR